MLYTRRHACPRAIKKQPTIEGRRLSHSCVNSYDSSNAEEEMMAFDSKPKLTD